MSMNLPSHGGGGIMASEKCTGSLELRIVGLVLLAYQQKTQTNMKSYGLRHQMFIIPSGSLLFYT